MPIYEYRCSECGHELEALQKISDAPLTQCPKCHADGLSKQVSAPPFHLKGTGWYVTDFRDKGKNQQDKSTESSQTAGDKPTEKTSKSDSGSETSNKAASSKKESTKD